MFWGFDRVFKHVEFCAIGTLLANEKADRVVQRKSVMIIFVVGLLAISFVFSYLGLTVNVMWFVTAMIGVGSIAILSFVIDKCNLLQYLGQISLVILCIHGPVYRIIVKL